MHLKQSLQRINVLFTNPFTSKYLGNTSRMSADLWGLCTSSCLCLKVSFIFCITSASSAVWTRKEIASACIFKLLHIIYPSLSIWSSTFSHLQANTFWVLPRQSFKAPGDEPGSLFCIVEMLLSVRQEKKKCLSNLNITLHLLDKLLLHATKKEYKTSCPTRLCYKYINTNSYIALCWKRVSQARKERNNA